MKVLQVISKLIMGLLSFIGFGNKASGDKMVILGKIVAVLRDEHGRLKKILTTNVVTNEGDIFYAQKGAGETPTYPFGNLVLGSTPSPDTDKASTYDSITPIANTEKAPASGYPKTNDQDADNVEAAVDSVTYKYTYATSDFSHSEITEGVITVPNPQTGAKVLCHFAFDEPFGKTSSDTLTVYVNHNMNGASTP